MAASAKSFLIVDDHEIVRTGLREIIEQHSGWKVTGEASNGMQGLELARAKTPDVIIVDYSMPVLNGIEVCRRIKLHRVATQVLFLTVHDGEDILFLRRGAGYPPEVRRPESTNLSSGSVVGGEALLHRYRVRKSDKECSPQRTSQCGGPYRAGAKHC